MGRQSGNDMMCQGQSFFHIQKAEEGWELGSRISTSAWEHNRFFKRCLCGQALELPGIGRGLDLEMLRLFFEQTPEYRAAHAESVLRQTRTALKEHALSLRELVFEGVRNMHYPDRPSRTKSVFLCTEQTVAKWWDCLAENTSRILRVRVNGSIHYGEEALLKANTFSYKALVKRAHEYWSNRNLNGDEVLFSGELEVTNVYGTLEELLPALTNRGQGATGSAPQPYRREPSNA